MTVVVALRLSGEGNPQVVVSAASMLFEASPAVRVAFCVPDDELGEAVAHQVSAMVAASPPPSRFPDAVLVDESEAVSITAVLTVCAGESPAEDARSVVLLAALAETLEGEPAKPAEQIPPPITFDAIPPGPRRRITARAARAGAEAARARRDLARLSSTQAKVRVCVVLQHVAYWGAVQTVCEAWSKDPRVDLVLVAVEGFVHSPDAAARLLSSSGYDVRSPDWVVEHAADVDVVVLDGPYDRFRPSCLQAEVLAASGVRLVYVPYGSNVGASELLDHMVYDLPLQNLAWRVYVRSEIQVEEYAQVCSVGADHLRVMGTPKVDRALRASVSEVGRAWRAQAHGRPVVLWNPHYSVPADLQIAWSTYHQNVEQIVSVFRERDDAVLLVRPHFKLWATLRTMGAEGARLEAVVRDAERDHENVLVDEQPDYEDAFAVADVLVSDASSLISEFVPTGRPVVYTHRGDGPGLSRDAAYVKDLYRTSSPRELRLVLSSLLDGRDRQRERRLQSVREHFPHEDGAAGARIADDVVTGCLRERGLVPAQHARLR